MTAIFLQLSYAECNFIATSRRDLRAISILQSPWVKLTVPSSSHFRLVHNLKKEVQHLDRILLRHWPWYLGCLIFCQPQPINMSGLSESDWQAACCAFFSFLLHSLLSSHSVFTFPWWGDCQNAAEVNSLRFINEKSLIRHPSSIVSALMV